MDDLKSIIGKVATGATLSRDEAASAFDSMMSGEATPSQMGGLLMALRVRGETVDEITGDLIDGFAANAQRHQQSAHLRGRRFAGHHAVESGCRLVARQRRAGGDFPDDRFEVVHRLLSECSSILRHDPLRRTGLRVYRIMLNYLPRSPVRTRPH